jgi:DNA ligase (NAD+)
MNIDGLGPETVNFFYERKLIANAADLYKLNENQILHLPGFKEKSAKNIVTSIRKSVEVPYERVVFALGIRFVGETIAKRLAKAFVTIDELMAADAERLTLIDDIGPKIAQSVVAYFATPANRTLVEALREAGIQLSRTDDKDEARTDKLAGLSIVISGVFARHSRDEYKAMIERNGGKNVGSISSKTNFVLAGEDMGPAKREKAQQLGIEILDEDTFLSRYALES